jgi:uncharacterized protein YcbX
VHVEELWRFPVKSLRGERLEHAHVAPDGLDGDRLVHVREPGGRVVTARYRPRLLGLAGSLGDDGEPLIDGLPWDRPESLAKVRAAAAAGVDHRRFRPNVLIGGVDGLTEREWVGRGLRLGDVLIGVRKTRSRCVMTTFDPDTLEQDLSVLSRVVNDFDGRLALDCWVVEPGRVSVGDPVSVVPLPDEVRVA